jgi:hypothetical protein
MINNQESDHSDYDMHPYPNASTHVSTDYTRLTDNHQRPSRPPPMTDEALAWEIAETYSTMDSCEIDPSTLHPIFQKQLLLALKSRMPKNVAGEDTQTTAILPKVLTRSSTRGGFNSKLRNLEDLPDETVPDDDDDWCSEIFLLALRPNFL